MFDVATLAKAWTFISESGNPAVWQRQLQMRDVATLAKAWTFISESGNPAVWQRQLQTFRGICLNQPEIAGHYSQPVGCPVSLSLAATNDASGDLPDEFS